MNINNSSLPPNTPGAGSTELNRSTELKRAAELKPAQAVQQTTQSAGAGAAGSASQDDVHLSELVRSLRSLAADSPERQARIEKITRAYADGTYRPDPQATADAIIDHAFERNTKL